MVVEVKVPSVGESVTEATLAEWFKKDGDQVKKDEPLFVIETDKVTLEVVAETDGILSIKVPAGQTVAIGEVVGTIDANDDVIRRYDALPDDLVLAGNGNVTWYVSYVPSGQTRTTGGGMQIGTIRACTKSAAVGNDYRSKDLAINASGRVAVSVTAGVASDCPDP